MKKAVLSLGLILLSSMAFAEQRIDLAAGSSITLQADTQTQVTCSGSARGTQCGLQQSPYGGYSVLQKSNTIVTGVTLQSALDTIKKLSDAGLCN